jgi:hypothetical protein
LFLVAFAGIVPETCQPETTIEKQEDCKNNLDFLGKILEPWTDEHVYSKDEIEEDYEPGEVLGKFLHAGQC